jgi:hypothetical protein
MVICIADQAEFFEERSETELANPAGYSKSIGLEPFRNSIKVRTSRSCSCHTCEGSLDGSLKSFIFSEWLQSEYTSKSFVSHTYARGTS